MAASIKISELNSLTNLTDVDLFLVSDMETGTSRKISYNNLKSNIITETSSALTDLEGVVAQNRTDAETLVETIRVALQASIDGNTASLSVADDGLDARLQVLEADPTTQTALDVVAGDVTQNATNIAALQTSDDGLDARLQVLEADPTTQTALDVVADGLDARLQVLEADPTTQTALDVVAGDVTQNATNIAALQTSIDNLDIDIAPETLNSIDELAQALGDDPQIITNLQAELTAYKAHIEERNLELALAFDVPTYAEIIYGG